MLRPGNYHHISVFRLIKKIGQQHLILVMDGILHRLAVDIDHTKKKGEKEHHDHDGGNDGLHPFKAVSCDR